MRIVHLTTFDVKFTSIQLNFLLKEFPQEDQLFFLVGGGARAEKLLCRGVCQLNLRNLPLFALSIFKADRIIFNGLFNYFVVTFFSLMPWLLRKSVWVQWGGDVYWPELVPNTFYNRCIDILRGFFIRQLLGIATGTQGDYLKAVNLYKTTARYIDGCPNIYAFDDANLDRVKIRALENRKDYSIKRIMVGNSADPSNNHFDVLGLLEKFKSENIEIYVPLSYGFIGHEKYKKDLLEYGNLIFENKFFPVSNMLSPAEYNNFLAGIDILIFNHHRSQGFNNLAIAMYLGTKIFLRKDVSTFDLFSRQMDCVLFDTCDITSLDYSEFSTFSSIDSLKNKNSIKHLFDRRWQRRMWEKIYQPILH